jgi:hypothetical protein
MEQEISAQLAVIGNTALKYPTRPEIQHTVELKVTRGGAPNPNKQVKITIEPVKSDRELFEEYYTRWNKQTWFYSSSGKIVENENFKAIVKMGTRATPFIVEKIKQAPSLLVWALGAIYNKRISQTYVGIKEAGDLWLKELNM